MKIDGKVSFRLWISLIFFIFLIVFFIACVVYRESFSLYLGHCLYTACGIWRHFVRKVGFFMDAARQYKGCLLFLVSFCFLLYYLFPFENFRLRVGYFYRSLNRYRALFFLGLSSFFMYLGYGIAKFNEEVPFLRSEIIPDSLLIVFLALPTAWGLWIWRNEDKASALKNEKESLVLEKSKSDYDIFFRLTEMVTDRNALLSLRIVAISGLVNGYLLKEHHLQKMCETFLCFFINQIQKERKSPNPQSGLDLFLEQIIPPLLSYYARKSEEVRGLDFSDYIFRSSTTLSDMKFVSCNFNKCIMDGVEVNNVEFHHCGFHKFCLNNTTLNHVKFLSCRDAVHFEIISDSKFQSVRFEDSMIEIEKLTDTTFHSCELKDTILSPEQYKSYFRVV